MALSAANDKFLKVRRNFSTTIGTGGVANATVQTVPLASTTNIPSDTPVIVYINRVDANGALTNNFEGTVGEVSGTNLINCVRGAEGTAQAWASGVVVEIIWTETNVNRMVDGILAEHNQDGTHKTASVVTPTGIQTLTNKTLTSPLFQGIIDGWTSSPDTWVYASATSFTITGVDRTAVFTKGTRIKCTNNAITYYGTVISSSFATNTTVNLAPNSDFALANVAITNPFYSYEASPQGYPSVFNYTPTFSGFTGAVTTTLAKFSVFGSLMTILFSFNGTSNAANFDFTIPIISNSSGTGSTNQTSLGVIDNGVNLTTLPVIGINTGGIPSTTVKVGKTFDTRAGNAYGGFTTSGGKGAEGFIIVPI